MRLERGPGTIGHPTAPPALWLLVPVVDENF